MNNLFSNQDFKTKSLKSVTPIIPKHKHRSWVSYISKKLLKSRNVKQLSILMGGYTSNYMYSILNGTYKPTQRFIDTAYNSLLVHGIDPITGLKIQEKINVKESDFVNHTPSVEAVKVKDELTESNTPDSQLVKTLIKLYKTGVINSSTLNESLKSVCGI